MSSPNRARLPEQIDPRVAAEIEQYRKHLPWADPSQLLAQQAGIAMREAFYTFIEARARFLEPFGLTPARYVLVRTLYLAEEKRLPMSALSRQLSTSATNVTKQIDWLEQRGWVARVPHDSDRRVMYAQLTPEGEARIATLFPATLRFAGDAWDGIPEAELMAFIGTLAKLCHNLGERYGADGEHRIP